jgi:uncharacterized protein YjbJ (UPF0337 family)
MRTTFIVATGSLLSVIECYGINAAWLQGSGKRSDVLADFHPVEAIVPEGAGSGGGMAVRRRPSAQGLFDGALRRPRLVRRRPSAPKAVDRGERHIRVEAPMNWDQIAGNWKQFVGKAKEQWGKLTDSDWDIIAGKRDQLVGKIQERYGKTREEAEREVAEYERTQSSSVSGAP